MSSPFLGEVRCFGFNFAPKGWATCDGQLLSIQQNTALFALLGTTYGGNGVNTFALPDLRSRTPLHFGQGLGLSPYSLGEPIGVETVTLVSNQLPQHSHPLIGVNVTADKRPPTGRSFANDSSATADFYAPPGGSTTTLSPSTVTATGGSAPHSNMQPYLVVNFCIAMQGIFPSRN